MGLTVLDRNRDSSPDEARDIAISQGGIVAHHFLDVRHYDGERLELVLTERYKTVRGSPRLLDKCLG